MTKARTEGQKRRQKREPVVREPVVVIAPDVREIGPTDQTKRHGDYKAPDSKGALAVYTNADVDYLARLRSRGVVSARQFAAGRAFEATHQRAWGQVSPSRDSTIPPVGGMAHETEAEADKVAKAKARLNTILNRVGPAAYALLRSVCVYGESIGINRGPGKAAVLARRALLLAALTECAVAYGLTSGDLPDSLSA